jgi:fumarate hydratase class I
MEHLYKSIYTLIARTTSDLPEDVENALERARRSEMSVNAAKALDVILQNSRIAREQTKPICQDTGTLAFWVEAPPSIELEDFKETLYACVRDATKAGLLRQNCVDPATGRNTANNLGPSFPLIHWEPVSSSDAIRVTLIQKGGGCENTGQQFSLPDTRIGASRNFEGVRRCALHAVKNSQGFGCPPSVMSVCIGGDRATGYVETKKAFLRQIGRRNAIPEIGQLEERILKESNNLAIGPMGFGGSNTLLDVFVSIAGRVPASYFVTISFMCWAFRRRSIVLNNDGSISNWQT